jgi:hypothetical protein
MDYISKAEREATLWLTRRELIEHIRAATGKDESGACKQIGAAIADRELPVVWGDLLESFWKSGGSGLAIPIADKPPRDSQFWRQGPFDPDNPRKGQFDPNDPDRVLVGWYFALVDPDKGAKPRFRKPMFWRDRAEDIWRLPPATTRDEKKAINFLTPIVKADPKLPFQKALDMCREKIPQLSEHGFRYRVWPEAREAAGLSKTGISGRQKRRNRQHGPAPGSVDRFGDADRALFSEIELIMRNDHKTLHAAALELAFASKVQGVGSSSPESRARRLAARFRKERPQPATD